MKVTQYYIIILLCCLLQSTLTIGLAQILETAELSEASETSELSEASETSETFFSVSIDPTTLSTSLPIIDVQGGILDGNTMTRIGLDFPSFMFDVDVSSIYPIEETGISVFGGVGANLTNFVVFAFGLDVHAGLEYRLDDVGIFTEYESTFITNSPDGAVLNALKFGLNIYF